MNTISPLSTTLERCLLVSSFSIYYSEYVNDLQLVEPEGRPVAIALDTVSRPAYFFYLEKYTNAISQKGPEIRTGLTREGKDVRHFTTPDPYDLIIISCSGQFPLAMNSSSRPTPNSVKFAMTRLCGSTM